MHQLKRISQVHSGDGYPLKTITKYKPRSGYQILMLTEISIYLLQVYDLYIQTNFTSF